MRTDNQWLEWCDKITAGYVPGGEKRNVYLTRYYLVNRLLRWAKLEDNTRLLDWGCGNGRLPMGLVEYYPALRYVGIDIIKPCIEFCKQAFAPWRSYGFGHIDIKNNWYWSIGSVEPTDLKLPFHDRYFDVLFANSLFTHAGRYSVADHFISEAYRVLKPGGVMVSTWILRDDPDYAESVTVYTNHQMLSLLKDRFEITGRLGCPETPNNQTELAARKI